MHKSDLAMILYDFFTVKIDARAVREIKAKAELRIITNSKQENFPFQFAEA